MKKALLLLASVLAVHTVNAQNAEQTAKGKWLIETNTAFGNHLLLGSETGFRLTTVDGETIWNLGAETGYFIIDNLAVKVGLGYGDFGTEIFSYKLGLKYYIIGKIPVAADLNGMSGEGFKPMFAGLQGGFAVFLGEMVSIEPGIRYNFDINDDAEGSDGLQINVGFVLHF